MKKIIIKVGSSTLLSAFQNISRRSLLELVQQMALLHRQGVRIVLVSSGAVAAGKELVGADLAYREAYACIGQVKVMQVWSELFALFDLQVAQALLSKDSFTSECRSMLEALLQHGVIPIINENDPVVTATSRIGDNDNLAALVATLIEADAMILLTDQEGLYSADPRSNPDARLISCVTKIDQTLTQCAGAAGTSGTGGMRTKIEAAQYGVNTYICSAFRPNVLLDLFQGKNVGTYITLKEVCQ